MGFVNHSPKSPICSGAVQLRVKRGFNLTLDRSLYRLYTIHEASSICILAPKGLPKNDSTRDWTTTYGPTFSEIALCHLQFNEFDQIGTGKVLPRKCVPFLSQGRGAQRQSTDGRPGSIRS